MSCIPNMSGAKNPQTGQMDRKNNKTVAAPIPVMAGTTLGQYTLHADESTKPLTLGKYTVKYSNKLVLAPSPKKVKCNKPRLALSLLQTTE
jgi:hypothetical protein